MARRKDFSVDLASDEATREQMLAAFRRASELGLISQVRLEAELGVDQGQVSKILRGNFVYPRGNARRIFTYVKKKRPFFTTESVTELLRTTDASRNR